MLADRGPVRLRQIVTGTLRVGDVATREENVGPVRVDLRNAASAGTQRSGDGLFDRHLGIDQEESEEEFPGHFAFVGHVNPQCL